MLVSKAKRKGVIEMSLDQYKDANRGELWDILQIQMQVLQAEVAKNANLGKEITEQQSLLQQSLDREDGMCVAIEQLQSTLEERDATISALRAQLESKWISVEDEVPKESGRYWCYVKGVSCLGYFYQQDNCSYNAEENKWNSEVWQNRGEFVKAWMPLPSPPTKGE